MPDSIPEILDHFGRRRATIAIDPETNNPSVVFFNERGEMVACLGMTDTDASVFLYDAGSQPRVAAVVPYQSDDTSTTVIVFDQDGKARFQVSEAKVRT